MKSKKTMTKAERNQKIYEGVVKAKNFLCDLINEMDMNSDEIMEIMNAIHNAPTIIERDTLRVVMHLATFTSVYGYYNGFVKIDNIFLPGTKDCIDFYKNNKKRLRRGKLSLDVFTDYDDYKEGFYQSCYSLFI